MMGLFVHYNACDTGAAHAAVLVDSKHRATTFYKNKNVMFKSNLMTSLFHVPMYTVY